MRHSKGRIPTHSRNVPMYNKPGNTKAKTFLMKGFSIAIYRGHGCIDSRHSALYWIFRFVGFVEMLWWNKSIDVDIYQIGDNKLLLLVTSNYNNAWLGFKQGIVGF